MTEISCSRQTLLRLALIRILGLLGRPGLQANLVRKILTCIRRHEQLQLRTGFCTVCGRKTRFIGTLQRPRETYWCCYCCASARNRSVASAILQYLGDGGKRSLKEWVQTEAVRRMRIWQMQAQGPIYWALRRLPGHVGSEFVEGVVSGSRICGIRIEDAHRASFRDSELDLIISEDVFEHVADPMRCIREAFRVLKPGGWCVVSVPLGEGMSLLPGSEEPGMAEWHEDPLSGRSKVFTRWGREDVCAIWAEAGFRALLAEGTGVGQHDSGTVICQRSS